MPQMQKRGLSKPMAAMVPVTPPAQQPYPRQHRPAPRRRRRRRGAQARSSRWCIFGSTAEDEDQLDPDTVREIQACMDYVNAQVATASRRVSELRRLMRNVLASREHTASVIARRRLLPRALPATAPTVLGAAAETAETAATTATTPTATATATSPPTDTTARIRIANLCS